MTNTFKVSRKTTIIMEQFVNGANVHAPIQSELLSGLLVGEPERRRHSGVM